MTTPLTDVQYELFEHLTERPFLVMDLEWAHHQGADHLISVAVTPVVRGKRSTADEIYVEMNPGVPIDAATSAVHGFTDAKVKGKRRFAHFAPRILAALAVPDAILVTHTAVDLRVLGEELARASSTTGSAAELADLPLLDTSTLPRLVQHPVAAGRRVISLRALCEGLGVTLDAHHNAKADARATADALVKLLRHTATEQTFGSIDALLRAAGAGTARSPRGATYPRRRQTAPSLPRAHLEAHAVEPLTHAGSEAEHAAWVGRARECVQLRCDILMDEAEHAAPHNAGELLPALSELVDTALARGQAGTLAGALQVLLRESGRRVQHPVSSPALARDRVTYWWRAFRKKLYAAPRCSRSDGQACPACWDGTGCVTDLLYQTTTELVAFSTGPDLTADIVRNRFLGDNEQRIINRWPANHPLETSYLVELICRWAESLGLTSTTYLDAARAKGIEMVEPRLALRVLNQELPVLGFEQASKKATQVLARRNTDPAYAEIEAWLALNAAAEEHNRRRSEPRAVVRPRQTRPEGRVPYNPYRPF